MSCSAQNEDFRFSEIFAIINPIVKKIRTALGKFLFKNSEILSQHSFGIYTSFATMSDQPTYNLGFFVQATVQPTQSVQPLQTLQPIQPIQPIELIRPIQPIQSMQPVQPIQAIQPFHPVKPK